MGFIAQPFARAVSPTERPECMGALFAATDRVRARMTVAMVNLIAEMLILGRWGCGLIDCVEREGEGRWCETNDGGGRLLGRLRMESMRC
jgi:hypothetical protein